MLFRNIFAIYGSIALKFSGSFNRHTSQLIVQLGSDMSKIAPVNRFVQFVGEGGVASKIGNKLDLRMVFTNLHSKFEVSSSYSF